MPEQIIPCSRSKSITLRASITFIDYSAAFDTESQMFLDEALAQAGVGAKVRRIVQAIFAVATGVVRLKHPDGTMTLSEPFDITRGVLQGDIFSPVAFIIYLLCGTSVRFKAFRWRLVCRHICVCAHVCVGAWVSIYDYSIFKWT